MASVTIKDGKKVKVNTQTKPQEGVSRARNKDGSIADTRWPEKPGTPEVPVKPEPKPADTKAEKTAAKGGDK